jgi:hypothetical protein
MQLSDSKIVEQQRFQFYTVALTFDNIIRVDVAGNHEIDVADVKIIVDAIEKIGEGKIYPLLIVTGEYTLPTPEARAYIATSESDPFASAEAYVVKSLSQKLVGNVFLSFNKPARPTKIFNSEEKALEWLKGFL